MSLLKQKNVSIYLVITVLMTLSYALPHAILTVLLLSKGISISQILLIQACYSVGIILSEFPSGLISDIWSRKSIYIIAKLFLLVMYLLVWLSANFWVLAFAWFLYGISAALDSGTLDSEIIVTLKETGQTGIETFVSIDNRIQTFSLLLGSLLGSILYSIIGINIYLLSIVLVSIAIGLTIFFYRYSTQKSHSDKRVTVHSLKQQVANSLSEIRHHATIRHLFIIDLISQIFFQTHFQLWQSFLLEKHLKENSFVIFYIIFQVISIFAYSTSLSSVSKMFETFNAKIICGLLAMLPFALLSDNMGLVSLSYVTLVFVFYRLEYMSNAFFNKRVSAENISSLISFKSTVTRLFSMVLLIITSGVLTHVSVSVVIVVNFFIAFVALASCAIFLSKGYGGSSMLDIG